MFPILCLVAASLPFFDLEVMRIAGRSLVLPYCAAFLLAVPVLPRLNRASRYLSEDPALPLLGSWFLSACASSAAVFFWSGHPELLDRNLMQLANVLLMIVQYVLFVIAFRTVTRQQLNRVVGVVAVTAVIAAAYTLYQISLASVGLPVRDVLRTSSLYLKINTLVPGGAGGWAGHPRAFGVAPEPSFWGAYLTFTLGFVLWRTPWRFRLRDVLACLLLLAAVAATFSRSAWVTAAILTSVAGLTWLPVRLPRIAIPAIAVALIALMIWPLVLGDQVMEAFTDMSAIGRVASQKTGWQMFLASPVLGIGLGSSEFFTERHAIYLPGQGDFPLQYLYNCYLLVLVSTGILGFSLFVAYLLKLADSIAAVFRIPSEGADVRRLQIGSALAYLASLGFWVNTPAYNVTFVWFAFALASAMPRILADRELTPAPGNPAWTTPS